MDGLGPPCSFLTGLPVECQFNVGCDTCTYRRGKLQGGTIRKIMILKHGDKDLIDPGLLDDCQLAEREDEETHQKNETNIARKATFDERVRMSPCNESKPEAIRRGRH